MSAPGRPNISTPSKYRPRFFPCLGIELFRGRTFLDGENRPGAAQVAIISYRLWQRRFGASAHAVGSELVFDGHPQIVVGVTPAKFRIGDDEIDVFTPLGQDDTPLEMNREAHGTAVWARLRPGATLAQAQQRTGRRRPPAGRRSIPISNKGRTFVADALRPDAGDVQPTLWLLLGAVSLVLSDRLREYRQPAACARRFSRSRIGDARRTWRRPRSRWPPMPHRKCGARRSRGGVLGISLAAIGVRPVHKILARRDCRAPKRFISIGVCCLFALGISLFCGILFGLAPALRAPLAISNRHCVPARAALLGSSRRLHSVCSLPDRAGGGAAGLRRNVGAHLLRLSALDPGVNIHNVLIARTALSPATLADPARIRAAWQDILDHARAVRACESVAMVDTVPMREGDNEIDYWTTPRGYRRRIEAAARSGATASRRNICEYGYAVAARAVS